MNDFQCRRANKRDSTDVVSLLFELKSLYGSCAEKNIEDFNKNYITTINEIINSPNHIVYVVEKNQTILGFLSSSIRKTMRTNGNLAVLEEIYVYADYRRQGIGTILWNVFEEQIKNTNIEWVEVVSSMKIEGQKAFYEKMGLSKYSTISRKRVVC